MSQSVNNSLSNRDVPVDFHFNGAYDDVIEYSQILVNITTASAVNSYTLTIYYSDDKLQFSTIMSAYTNYTNQYLTFSPKARYFKLSITANTVIERLVIETMYKNTNIYDSSILSNLFNVNLTQSIPLEIQTLPSITIANTTFDSNITASVPLTISTLPSITIANTGFTSNITTCIPLTISTLPSITIANTGFNSNIVASVPLTISSLPSITIANTGFTSNITSSIVLHTILDSVNSNITIFIQERPTTISVMSYALSATGLIFYNIPQVLRQLSINNTGASIAFVYIYNMATVPTNLDTPIFLFAINGSNNVIFNPMDHHFTTGISMRATTLLNGIVSPLPNSIILNMTLNN